MLLTDNIQSGAAVVSTITSILRFEEMQTVTQQFFIFKFCVIHLINLMQKESL